MGYDSNECLICYLSGNGNNPTHSTAYVCLECLNTHGKKGHVTGRVTSALNSESVFCSITSCGVCHDTGMAEQLGICANVCSKCQGSTESESDEDDSY